MTCPIIEGKSEIACIKEQLFIMLFKSNTISCTKKCKSVLSQDMAPIEIYGFFYMGLSGGPINLLQVDWCSSKGGIAGQ